MIYLYSSQDLRIPRL